MRSLRAREFVAIALAIVASVGVTLVLAVVLVRNQARHEALKSLARQAALVAEQQRAAPAGQRALEPRRLLRHPAGANGDPDAEAGRAAPAARRRHRPPQRATRPGHGRCQRPHVSLCHPSGAAAGRRHAALGDSSRPRISQPFTIAFGIAAAVGAAIAALAAFLLARAVSRPIERVSEASLALAAGERPGPLPEKGSTEVAALAESFNRLADDLDRAKAAERQFLLSVSHELKTPLAAIRGHGEALLDGVMTIPQAAPVVVEESKRLERLVRDLLDLARLNQRSFSVHPQEVDLAGLATDAVNRHRAESMRVGVGLHAETNGPSPALADPDRTLQVLSNLIENALRCTPTGGSVTVAAHGGVLTVADTGPGLADDELPHAFERFFLYSRYARHRAVGTGLGLAIVKELTEAMDGSLSVKSVQGKGTVFTVRLPQGE